MYYKCPSCAGKIDYLDYYSTVQESGTFFIEAEDFDCNDSCTDSISYECPLCNESVNRDDLDEWIEEDEEKKTDPQTERLARTIEETPNAQAVTNIEGIFEAKSWYGDVDQEDKFLREANICPDCLHFFPRMTERETAETTCPECGLMFEPGKHKESQIKQINKNKKIIKVGRKIKRKKNANKHTKSKRIQVRTRSRS